MRAGTNLAHAGSMQATGGSMFVMPVNNLFTRTELDALLDDRLRHAIIRCARVGGLVMTPEPAECDSHHPPRSMGEKLSPTTDEQPPPLPCRR